MPQDAPGVDMVAFPMVENAPHSAGALVKASMGMKPGAGGTLVYFVSDDCSIESGRAVAAGGKVLQPKMPIGAFGFIAICEDTEGNPIGIHSMK